MPRLRCIPALGQRIELVEKRRESELRSAAAPNPSVTTGGAPMSRRIKATGIVPPTTGARAFCLFNAARHITQRAGDEAGGAT